jgi:hypothetical protein
MNGLYPTCLQSPRVVAHKQSWWLREQTAVGRATVAVRVREDLRVYLVVVCCARPASAGRRRRGVVGYLY